MGSLVGPNYACLFVGYVYERVRSYYTGLKPDLRKRYMVDVAGGASCGEEDFEFTYRIYMVGLNGQTSFPGYLHETSR